MTPIGTFRIGADITIALDAVSGDVAEIATVTAAMRPGVAGKVTFTPDNSLPTIPMTVAPRAASGSIPAGWNLTLAAADSANLTQRLYAIDAKLVGVAGSVDITETSAVIMVTRAAV